MDTENMSTMELLEANEHNIYAELQRTPYNDPNRGKLLDEAELYYKVRNGYEQTEQNRLNNYVKNEIEDRKADAELKKAKNDRFRAKLGFGQALLFFFGGTISGVLGYGLDTWYQKDRRLQKWQETCQNLSRPK